MVVQRDVAGFQRDVVTTGVRYGHAEQPRSIRAQRECQAAMAIAVDLHYGRSAGDVAGFRGRDDGNAARCTGERDCTVNGELISVEDSESALAVVIAARFEPAPESFRSRTVTTNIACLVSSGRHRRVVNQPHRTESRCYN